VWPSGEIDHKNGVRNDDRFNNLRDVARSGNTQNQRHAHKNNKLGLLGVTRHGKKFSANIQVNGKPRYLGLFSTPEEAYAVYVIEKRKLHPFCTI
jgi:hypothetical protein